jgi:hypothetical protein
VTDIVERLRAWVYTDSQYATAREAADDIERLRALCDRRGELAVERRREIARLRNGALESRETVQCPHVVGTTTQYCSLTPFTLTDEEREVLLTVEADASYRAMDRTEKVVRGLLERTK